MPKEKYTKPPKPLPPMEQIQRVRFRFDDEDRQELMAMLPARLHEFGHRDDPVVGRSGAEMLIQTFEEAIGSYRTIELLTERFGAPNRADIVAAIRRLRQALAPFATAAMDPGTVDVLLGAFLGTFTTFDAPMAMTTLRRVDVMLADRERELSGTAIAPWSARHRKILRELLGGVLRGNCSTDMTDAQMARFLARALDFAGIKHDDPEAHQDRLIPKAG